MQVERGNTVPEVNPSAGLEEVPEEHISAGEGVAWWAASVAVVPGRVGLGSKAGGKPAGEAAAGGKPAGEPGELGMMAQGRCLVP